MENPEKPKLGGWKFHKPGCNCYPCKARRRKEEALALPAGTGGYDNPLVVTGIPVKEAEEVLEPDLPPILRGSKKRRDRLAEWIALRHEFPNLKTYELAEKMGIVPQTLYNLINKATKDGLLKFEDPMSRIEHEIIPKVLENIIGFLDEKDKTITLETAKATIFRQYTESKGIRDLPTTVLAFKIESVPGDSPKVVTGTIVGNPKGLIPAKFEE